MAMPVVVLVMMIIVITMRASSSVPGRDLALLLKFVLSHGIAIGNRQTGVSCRLETHLSTLSVHKILVDAPCRCFPIVNTLQLLQGQIRCRKKQPTPRFSMHGTGTPPNLRI